MNYPTHGEVLITPAALAEKDARIAELEAALRPIAECFENQENTDALIADFGYYSKQAARALEQTP